MRFVLIFIAALSLGGCAGTVDFLQGAEQRAAAVVAKIRAAAPLVQGEIDGAIGAVCGHLPEIRAGVALVVSGISSPGPKTAKAIDTADKSLDAATASCTAWAAKSSTAGSVGFFLRLYSAYTAGKNALKAAQAAGGA